ncbi:hypothetical protein HKD37_05G013033 [Glycine soja]
MVDSSIYNHFIVKFEHDGNDVVEVEAFDEGVKCDNTVGEVALEKLPEEGEGKSDLANVAEVVNEDGEGDVARGNVRFRSGAKENCDGEALRIREEGEDSVEHDGGMWEGMS